MGFRGSGNRQRLPEGIHNFTFAFQIPWSVQTVSAPTGNSRFINKKQYLYISSVSYTDVWLYIMFLYLVILQGSYSRYWKQCTWYTAPFGDFVWRLVFLWTGASKFKGWDISPHIVYSGANGAIRYFLVAELDEAPQISHKAVEPFQIVKPVDVNVPEYLVRKFIDYWRLFYFVDQITLQEQKFLDSEVDLSTNCICKPGKVVTSINIDKNGYKQGKKSGIPK